MYKQNLFKNAVKALDNWQKMIDLEAKCYPFPLSFLISCLEKHYKHRKDSLFHMIKENGWQDEFDDYALIF